jgi:hypothetical protein
MDDHPKPLSAQLTVSRCCEPSRLGGQLLSRAYEQLFPQVRRPLAGSAGDAPAMISAAAPTTITSTAARAAAGA